MSKNHFEAASGVAFVEIGHFTATRAHLLVSIRFDMHRRFELACRRLDLNALRAYREAFDRGFAEELRVLERDEPDPMQTPAVRSADPV